MGEGVGSGSSPLLTDERLKKGIRLVNDHIPGEENITISMCVDRGSRDAKGGAAHFLEHLITSGTKSFPTEARIDDEIEGLGGEINAETDTETMTFTIDLPTEHLMVGAQVLASIAQEPLFRVRDFATEKDVILHELSDRHDEPDSWLTDWFYPVAWGAHHPLGQPLAGTLKSVALLERDYLKSLHKRFFVGNAMSLVVSGGARLELAEAEKLFGGIRRGSPNQRVPPRWVEGMPHHFEVRPTNASAYWWAIVEGITETDPRRVPYSVTAKVLGRRLHKLGRKKHDGYRIFTDTDFYSDSGVFQLQSSSTNSSQDIRTLKRVLERFIDHIKHVAKYGPTAEELRIAKNVMTGGHRRETQTTSGRVEHYSEQLSHPNGLITPAEYREQVQAVTSDQVATQAGRMEKKLGGRRRGMRLLGITCTDVGERLHDAAMERVETSRPKDVNKADLVA
jgi:predicted Zn-dependent peptidase